MPDSRANKDLVRGVSAPKIINATPQKKKISLKLFPSTAGAQDVLNYFDAHLKNVRTGLTKENMANYKPSLN